MLHKREVYTQIRHEDRRKLSGDTGIQSFAFALKRQFCHIISLLVVVRFLPKLVLAAKTKTHFRKY